MSILTTFFGLIKPAKTDRYAIDQFNANMDKIDTEMHKPPLTVNEIEPDPTTRNIQITTVPLADNLTSDKMQINTGTYVIRSSGGEASISNGPAVLSEIRGEMVKTGYVPESIVPAVTVGEGRLNVTVDRNTFLEQVAQSGTTTFNYTDSWSPDLATYGVTVEGDPESGDQITVTYTAENRGTITPATPTAFVSTGWNLFNYSTGYARVVKYSDEFGFMVSGTYSTIKFSETLTGEKVTITPVNGFFTLPAGAEAGYVFITGGNTTDTAVWMTWSDWTEEYNDGTFEAYSQTSIDLTGVMVNFPYGLMRVGNYYDEINLNTQKAYSRIERMAYNSANLENVINSGVPYDTDESYIYAVREDIVIYEAEISGNYTSSDHGEEYFAGTSVPVTASSLYGNDLKSKLVRDVLTISQQELTEGQKAQVLQNIGGASQASVAEVQDLLGGLLKYAYYTKTVNVPANTSIVVSPNDLGFSHPAGYKVVGIARFTSGSRYVSVTYINPFASGNTNCFGVINNSLNIDRNDCTIGLGILYAKDDVTW